MKRAGIIIINVIIMTAILVFVVFYTILENENSLKRQTEHFENTTIAMEHVTENYLEGEQRICDVWARYINSKDMTMEEAASFIRISHVLQNASAHLIYVDTKNGISTRPHLGDEDKYDVSYTDMDFLNDTSWISDIGESINISRAYTNSMNGEQSIAFCNKIKLHDPETDTLKDAVLLRILPITELEEKWIFPQEEFKNAEITLIDEDGDYIIKSKTLQNSNFFEFFKSYNPSESQNIEQLKSEVTKTTGSRTILNSDKEEMLLAYTQISETVGWTFLSLIPSEDLITTNENWLLIGVISVALSVLFVIDLLFTQSLNKKLRITAKEAESASKAKTDFLSTMSHDIRTPMNAIIGLTTLIEKNIEDKHTVVENIRKIHLASNHLLTLINDILDISKVESGKLSLNPLTFSIVDTVENLINVSHPMIKEKNIDFRFHINRFEKEYLYADQLRINQIYINILSNAVKYTGPQGRVTVDLFEEPSDKEGYVRLTYIVEDTGIGMSKEYMAKMYEPFTRETDSRVNTIQGTGLGLTITKKMVDLMGGTIECESEEGKGTKFKIVLDIAIADRQITDDTILENIDVLLVDDDPVLLETGKDTLTSIGVNTETCESGRKALEMIDKRKEEGIKNYDVIILDWKMKEMDGVETLKRIKSEIDDSIPVLIISAYDWSDIEQEARNLGANGFISKPLFRSSLYDKINQALGHENKVAEPQDDYSDLVGLNILIAEDNEINWEIISAMLSMFGITAERAENGRVCVDKIKNAKENEYTLVFMDIQMPEMNGLDATRTIRKLDNKWAKSIPIIAMTADAFSENVTECLKAGMNGHIAKPVDIKLVVKEIRKIIERNQKS